MHTTYSIQKRCQKRNYVQNHINININIILLYGILQITVSFDMCTTFALGALHNFQIWYGAAAGGAKAQGDSYPHYSPLAPLVSVLKRGQLKTQIWQM